MDVPQEFKAEISQLFADFNMSNQVDPFFNALKKPPVYGLRVNRLKIETSTMRQWLADSYPQYKLSKVPWSDDGFYYPEALQPGTLPMYKSGLYYIQEPSAMLPAQVLAARPGEKILDLCAAPGGKSVRIAADMQEEGQLWANDISADRIRALLRNIELCGCSNALISNARPETLVSELEGFFDAIILDAPCSGSGMFRRDPAAIKSWQIYGTRSSVPIQRQLLDNAWSMLAPGGRMVYSTCTFSLDENEGNVAWFAAKHEDAVIMPINKDKSVSDGLPLTDNMKLTARIWPHVTEGEGHFCALIHKINNSAGDRSQQINLTTGNELPSNEDVRAFRAFCDRALSQQGKLYIEQLLKKGYLRLERNHLHLLAFSLPDWLTRKVKTGLYLGDIRRDRRNICRFEPSQALIMNLKAEYIKIIISAPADNELIIRYLRGETLQWTGQNPQSSQNEYGAICLEYGEQKWPMGWVRIMREAAVKNLYPAGWRQMR